MQPIAAPSILGLFGFAGATFIVAAHMAHCYGDAQTDLYLASFAATFGGIAQFAAGMWAFKARDAVATAMHGMWGAFWIAYGILQYQFFSGQLQRPSGAFPALGYWFIVLAAITWIGAWAASAENRVDSIVLGFLAAGIQSLKDASFYRPPCKTSGRSVRPPQAVSSQPLAALHKS